MTKRVVIFNASNWHGENLKIEGSRPVKEGQMVDDNFVILKPGESCSFDPRGYPAIRVIDVCEHTVAPFYLGGNQVLPACKTEWEVADGAERGSIVSDESVKNIKPNMDSARNP